MLQNGIKWGLFEEDEAGNVTILPTFARNTGRYPQNFRMDDPEIQNGVPEEEYAGDEGDDSE